MRDPAVARIPGGAGVLGGLAGAVDLTGYFRVESTLFDPGSTMLVPGDPPWEPTPAEPSDFAAGQALPMAGWIDPQQVEALRTAAGGLEAEAVDRLSVAVSISADGQVTERWVGAAEGLMAMRGGKSQRGVRARFHAIEADSSEPMHFVRAGIPPPEAGSLVVTYTDYVDSIDPTVAQTLSLDVEGDGVVVVRSLLDGGIELVPGRRRDP